MKINVYYLVLVLLVLGFCNSCKKDTGESLLSVTDYDGNTYRAIKIGNQVWMAQNLRTTHYADGTSLINGISSNIGIYGMNDTNKYYFSGSNSPDSTSLIIYGRWYTWAAIMNGSASSTASPSGVQGPCPNGWHVPSEAEWQTLVNALGGASAAGGVMKGYMDWNTENVGAGGTNESGFDVLGSGFGFPNGRPYYFQQRAYFWTSTQKDSADAVNFILYNNSAVVSDTLMGLENGLSCRCVQN